MCGKTLCRYTAFNDWVAICKLELISWADMQSVQLCGGWTVCGKAGGKSFEGCVIVRHSILKFFFRGWGEKKVLLEYLLMILP